MKIVSNNTYNQGKQASAALHHILWGVVHCINYADEYFIQNEIGSGYVEYNIDGKIFEFNILNNRFNGFFINGRKVQLDIFLSTLQESFNNAKKIQL